MSSISRLIIIVISSEFVKMIFLTKQVTLFYRFTAVNLWNSDAQKFVGKI